MTVQLAIFIVLNTYIYRHAHDPIDVKAIWTYRFQYSANIVQKLF